MTALYRLLPNLLSLFRIVAAPLLWYTIMQHYIIASLVLLSAAVLSDFYDGYFARRFNIVSATGMFLDPLADKVVVLAAFLALCQLNLAAWWVLAVIAGRDVVVTMMRTMFLRRGSSMKTSWLAKLKTAVQFGALYLLILGSGLYYGVFGGLGITERLSVRYLLGLIGVATAAITALSGVSYAWALMRRRGRH